MKSWILYVVVLFSYAEADHNPCEELAGDVSGQVTGSGFHLLTPAVREIREGETYRVVLVGMKEAFAHFTVAAKDSNLQIVGTWTPTSVNSRVGMCNDSDYVTNLNDEESSVQEFDWTAPSPLNGPIDFVYLAGTVNATTPLLNATLNRPPYKILAAIPEGCEEDPASCDYYAAWKVNEEDFALRDIELRGNVEGWIALGLSVDRLMGGGEIDDVLACQADPNGMVFVKDTFNYADSRGNLIDDPHLDSHNLTSQGIFNQITSLENGHMMCSFSRMTGLSGAMDFDLLGEHYLFFGLDPDGTGEAYASLSFHSFKIPIISTQNYSFTFDGLTMQDNLVPEGERGEIFLSFSNPLASFGYPVGCERSACQYYVQWFVDGDGLVFELEAASEGWVAIGLSPDPLMSGGAFDDVIACQATPNDLRVVGKDLNNPSGAKANELDSNQHVELLSGEVSNGRISCLVRRPNVTGDANDYPLDMSVYILSAYGTAQNSPDSALTYHGPNNRFLTGAPVNLFAPVIVTTPPPPPPELRAHGILMLWAWVLLAATAIFYARYTRPAYPNGEWFEVHRALLTASVVLTDIGFILIFVALRGFLFFGPSNPIGSAHFVIGCIVVGFQIYNPIIAAFRCHPGSTYRVIFDLIHGVLIGSIVEILAFINCGLGLWRFVEFTRRPEQFWVFVVLAIIVFLFEVTMATYHFISKYVLSHLSKPASNLPPADVELRATVQDVPDSDSDKSAAPKKKSPSKDSFFRRLAAIVFSIVIIIFLVVLTVLIGIGSY